MQPTTLFATPYLLFCICQRMGFVNWRLGRQVSVATDALVRRKRVTAPVGNVENIL